MVKKKPGPHPEHPKDTVIRARMDEITVRKLDECCETLNTTRSDILRKGIDKIHSELPRK